MNAPMSSPSPSVLRALLIVAVTFWVYSPAFHGDWLWDDSVLIVDNPLMSDPGGLRKIWIEPGVLKDYYPITFTVQRLEWEWFGIHRLGYHLVNIALHALSALLVWRLLARLGVRAAWWGGLLFAVHPVMVESVAWISELKNTLALPPLLLAMIYWIDYDERRSPRDYRQALILFAVAMLCKSPEMMLPAVLPLYAWWKRGRISVADWKAAAPFFAVALLLGGFGAWLEHHHAGALDFVSTGWTQRIATVGVQIFFLLSLCVFPVHLLPIYPNAVITRPTALDLWPWLSLAILAGLIWRQPSTWGRHVGLGLGFFLLFCAPVLGFIVMDAEKMIWSMDHLVYVPAIGVIGLAAAGLDWAGATACRAARGLVTVLASLIIAVLAFGSHAYAGLFGHAEALWTYAAKENPSDWMVYVNQGAALADKGRFAEAVPLYRKSIALNPTYPESHYVLAVASEHLGHEDEAIAEYKATLERDPNLIQAYEGLGNALGKAHRYEEAIASFERAVRLDSGVATDHFSLGTLYAEDHRYQDAADQFTLAIQLDANQAKYHDALANVLLNLNHLPEAAAELNEVIRLDPGDEKAHSDLGVSLAQMGRIPEALQEFQAALRMNPNNAGAHANLGGIYLMAGKFAEAIAECEAALRIQPNLAQAQQNLARAQALEKTQATSAKKK
jgi:tetratricopeptide (TPR) repeat protein